jgi:hypothetical protein
MVEIEELEILALSFESRSHYFLQVSGLTLSRTKKTEQELLSIFSQRRTPLAVTSDVFDIWPQNSDYWSSDFERENLSIALSLHELQTYQEFSLALLDFGYGIDVLIHKDISVDEDGMLKELCAHPGSVRFIFLESHLTPYKKISEIFSPELLGRMWLSYAPKVPTFDSLLEPEEVLIQIQSREYEFNSKDLKTRLVAFYNVESPIQLDRNLDFYRNPSKTKYLSLLNHRPGISFSIWRVLRSFHALPMLASLYLICVRLSHPQREFKKDQLIRYSQHFKAYSKKLLTAFETLGYILLEAAFKTVFSLRHLIRVYWFLKIVALNTFYGLRRISFHLLFPARKIYWFLDYQYQTRIAGSIPKNKNS